MKLRNKIISAMLLSGVMAAGSASVYAAGDKMAALKASIEAQLTKVNPNFKVESLKDSGLKGFYKVKIVNGPQMYMSEDGQYFFTGALFKMEGDKVVNLTEKDATEERMAKMGELVPAEMISFSPTKPVKTKATINVFTDVDCFYCQKLHQEVPELNARGIQVRYLAFPRAGVGSESYNKIVSAWCADNQQDALTKLKAREDIPAKTCDNPVTKQYELGKVMGVTGTPAIVLDDGTLIPGYRPAADLAKMLGI